MRVSSAEFIENCRMLSESALSEPVTITRDGRDRLVLVSAEEYERLKRRDRIASGVEDLSDADVDLILRQSVPDEYAHLDEELVSPAAARYSQARL